MDQKHQGNCIHVLTQQHIQINPQSLYFTHAPGTWLIPQSITIAPGLIHSPFTISALPAATTRISALPTYKKKNPNNFMSHQQQRKAELLQQQLKSAPIAAKLCAHPLPLEECEGIISDDRQLTVPWQGQIPTARNYRLFSHSYPELLLVNTSQPPLNSFMIPKWIIYTTFR